MPTETPPDAVLELLRQLQTEVREIRRSLSQHAKPLLTVDEVAELTGRAAFTVRRWIHEGRLKAERIQGTGSRGRLLIPREEILTLIRAGRGEHLPNSAVNAESSA